MERSHSQLQYILAFAPTCGVALLAFAPTRSYMWCCFARVETQLGVELRDWQLIIKSLRSAPTPSSHKLHQSVVIVVQSPGPHAPYDTAASRPCTAASPGSPANDTPCVGVGAHDGALAMASSSGRARGTSVSVLEPSPVYLYIYLRVYISHGARDGDHLALGQLLPSDI